MSFFTETKPPEHFARELLHDLKIDIVPTPLEEICAELGIELFFRDDLENEAYFAKNDFRKIIAINATIPNEARKRFSIAHEIGHFCLPNHTNEKYSCSSYDIHNFYNKKQVEKEANAFATELLIPIKHFSKEKVKESLSLGNIMVLSQKYNTSVVSTAIKVINQTEDLGALVFARNKEIQWTLHSRKFPPCIRNAGLIDVCSVANDFYDLNIIPPIKPLKNASWIWSDTFEGSYLIEETLCIPTVNCTLSLIRPTEKYIEENYERYYEI